MAKESLEHELMRALKYSGLRPEHLEALVRVVVELQQGGLQGIQVFPKGIPAPDSLEVKALLNPTQLEALFKRFVIDLPRVTRVVVFPYGIPAHEFFGVELQVS